MCPVCSTTLDQSDSPIARRMKADIAQPDRRRSIPSSRSRTSSSPSSGSRSSPRRRRRASTCSPGSCRSWRCSAARSSSASSPGAGAGIASRRRPPPRLEPGARAPRGRGARPLRRGLSLPRPDPRGVPRGRDLDHHALRASARARLPLGGLGRRGRPSGPARSSAPRRPGEPALHPRLHGRLRRARDRGGLDRRRPPVRPPARAGGPDPRRHRAHVHRAPAVARAPHRSRPADRRAATQLEHAPRCGLRGLRRAVHRRRARVDPRDRVDELGAQGRLPARGLLGGPRPRVPARGSRRSRRRWARSAGSATTTR